MAARKRSLEDTARDLNSAAIHLLRGMRSVDRQSGLTPARLSALSVLAFGGPTTLGRLAATEDVASPTMTRIVDGLVDLGLAARGPHPESARQVLVSATTAGEALMHDAAQRRFGVIVGSLRSMTAPDRRAIVEVAPALRELSALVGAVAARHAGHAD